MDEKKISLDEELEKKYDEICGVAYVNLFTLSKHHSQINLIHFDAKNKEHLFLAYVAKGLGGIVEKNVHLSTSKFQLWKINKGLHKNYKFRRIKDTEEGAINPQEVLEFMRPWASQLCQQENFNFGQIYDAFYNKKEKGKRK